MELSDEERHRNKQQSTTLLVFGEILFDCFPDGRKVLGGAPFNVAWNLTAFGQLPLMVSAVGYDPDGQEILDKAKKWGMPAEGVQRNAELATGEVQVELRGDEPHYTIVQPRAWDDVKDEGCSADGLIYYGSLALRSKKNRETLSQILNRSSAKRFVDLNVREPFFDLEEIKPWIQGIDWLKINLDELKLLGEKDSLDFSEADEAVRDVMERYQIKNILLTAGADGAQIEGEFGSAKFSPAPEPDPFVDAVGAGDSLASIAILGILQNWPAEILLERASKFAAKVCGLQGATNNNLNFYQTSWQKTKN